MVVRIPVDNIYNFVTLTKVYKIVPLPTCSSSSEYVGYQSINLDLMNNGSIRFINKILKVYIKIFISIDRPGLLILTETISSGFYEIKLSKIYFLMMNL